MCDCAGFGWDRVNFLHSSWYGATFWICAGNSVGNTAMFQLLLSSAYTESRPFLLLTPPHQRVGWGCTSWEGTQLGQLTPTDQRDIPYHMMSCSAYKAGEEEGRGGYSEWCCLSSQVSVTRDGALLSWRWLNACLPMGSSERIPCFVSLACTAFALPIRLSLSQSMRWFLIFTLLTLSPIPPGGSERASERLRGA